MTDREALDHMRRIYRQILPVAEAYGIIINIEPHGYFTTKPDFMAEMLAFADSPFLRMNMDTGNTFIAGQDPVAFAATLPRPGSTTSTSRTSATSLAAAARGELTGIAVSHCAIGDGVNADNIRALPRRAAATPATTASSASSAKARAGPMIERSLAWVRQALEAARARRGATA